PAISDLASRTPVPVEIDAPVGRLPTAVEANAYFVVAETLTNVAKHAHAAHAWVTARVADGALTIEVRDDAAGGAQPHRKRLLAPARPPARPRRPPPRQQPGRRRNRRLRHDPGPRVAGQSPAGC